MSDDQRPVLPPTVRQEVDEELSFHLEMRVRELVEQGMSERAARAEALRRFGDLVGVGVECRRLGEERDRGRRRVEAFAELRQDLRFGMRQLRRAPAFALVAVLTLALGIAATTAIFSVIDAVLLRPLPFAGSNRLVSPRTHNHGETSTVVSYGDFEDWRQARVFARVAVYQAMRINLDAPGGAPERVAMAVVSDDFLATLGVAPVLGRDLRGDDFASGGPARCLISYALWQRRFGGRRDVVGRQVSIGGRMREIVGVVPADLGFPAQTAVWLPLRIRPEDLSSYERRDDYEFESVARLQAGRSLAQTNAQLATLAARVSRQMPAVRGDATVVAIPLAAAVVGPKLPRALWLLLVAVALVLGIGCVNVANLLLARASTRRRELGLRSMLGATRTRILRQLLVESLVLGVASGVAGALLASVTTRLLLRLAPASLPRLEEVHVHAPVLVFALAVSLLATLLFGVGPALKMAGEGGVAEGGSRSATASRGRHRRLLVAAEVALSLVLLVAAGLVLRSLRALATTDPGFPTRGLLTFQLSLQGTRYDEDPRIAATLAELRSRLDAIPGVERAGLMSALPIGGGGFYLGRVFLPEGRPEPPAGEEVPGMWLSATPDTIRTLGVPLLAGRDFTAGDGPHSPPVIIVSREMARRMFGRVDVVGERLRSWRDENVLREIVGVVGDVRVTDAAEEIQPVVFVPAAQNLWTTWAAVMKVDGDPRSVLPAARAAVASVDPGLPLDQPQPMDEVFAASVAPRRFTALLVAVFAGIALVLALVGIYGVLSYEVAQRAREIGIRMALGSRRFDVLRLVVGEATALVAAGLLAGLAVALLAARFVGPLLYHTGATDPATYATAAGLLALVALAAAWLPARRAAAGDPMQAMRE